MNTERFVSAIIVAGGKGTRVSSLEHPKQFFSLHGYSVLYHSVNAFVQTPCIDEIIVVTLTDYVDAVKSELAALPKAVKVTVGGETRQQSVYQGTLLLDSRCTTIAVHDAARPFVTPQEIEHTVAAANQCAAVLGIRVTDTIKFADAQGFVAQTPDRSLLWAVQTPQVLPLPIYKKAYQKATNEGFTATDDVSLAEYLGVPVRLVEGSSENFKITNNSDLARAEQLFAQRMN